MDTALIILYLGFLYFLSHFFSWIFEKSRIPDVLLLIILGLIIGPTMMGAVTPGDFGKVGPVMTTVALTVILFESGTSLKLSALKSAAGPTLSIGLLTFIVTVLLTASVGYLAGLETLEAILLGSILGGTSAAVVIPLVNSLGMEEAPKTVLILESAITDVLCIILSFSLIDALAKGSVEIDVMLQGIGASLGVAALLGIAAGILWLQAWKVVHRFPNSTFTTIAYAFVVYGFVDSIGYSGAIGALTLGLTIANSKQFGAAESPLSPAERRFYGEIVFILKTFFFVYLGICMEFSQPLLVGVALLAILIVYLGRLGITRLIVSKAVSRPDAVLTSLMIPKGLAAAVLASVPAQMENPPPNADKIQAITFAGVFISILLTAVMIPALKTKAVAGFYDRFFKAHKPRGPEEDAEAVTEDSASEQTTTADASPTDIDDGSQVEHIGEDPDDPAHATEAASMAVDTTETANASETPATVTESRIEVAEPTNEGAPPEPPAPVVDDHAPQTTAGAISSSNAAPESQGSAFDSTVEDIEGIIDPTKPSNS